MSEKDAVWRETPLDHWSTAIDPAIMAGDEWVEPGDPGLAKAVTKDDEENLDLTKQAMMGKFQHPQHDSSYGTDS